MPITARVPTRGLECAERPSLHELTTGEIGQAIHDLVKLPGVLQPGDELGLEDGHRQVRDDETSIVLRDWVQLGRELALAELGAALVPVPGARRDPVVQELGEWEDDCGRVELGLRAEIAEEEHFGDAGAVGDLAGAGAPEAVGREQVLSSVRISRRTSAEGRRVVRVPSHHCWQPRTRLYEPGLSARPSGIATAVRRAALRPPPRCSGDLPEDQCRAGDAASSPHQK